MMNILGTEKIFELTTGELRAIIRDQIQRIPISREHFFQPMDHLGRSDVIGEQDLGKLGEVVREYHNVLGVGRSHVKWTHDP